MKKEKRIVFVAMLFLIIFVYLTANAALNLPDSLSVLDQEALMNTGFTGILDLRNTTVNHIAEGALDELKLHGLILNDHLKHIEDQHFKRDLAYVMDCPDGLIEDLTGTGCPKFILGNTTSVEKYPDSVYINDILSSEEPDSIDFEVPCVVNEYIEHDGFFYYVYDDRCALLCAVDNTTIEGEVFIPDLVDSYQVVYISPYAFYNCASIISVSIPSEAVVHSETMQECPQASLIRRVEPWEMRVALVTDYGDITDLSYNQTTYEAAAAFCNMTAIDFSYYKPTSDSDTDRYVAIENAVDDGFNVILLPGYAFGGIIGEIQDQYPDTIFIALDVTAGDLGGASLRDNVVCTTYKEEQSGFLAGYAAVCSGYRHLGFLGGMAVPGVVRYGYGFIQGCNMAAIDQGVTDRVIIEYGYGNQFYGDAGITANMDNWYQDLGVEIVFACGGGIFTSVAEAASKVQGGRVIGVDMDQAPVIDQMYGAGITFTSAMKNLGYTVMNFLSEISLDHFSSYGGQVLLLGIESDDPYENYVQLAPSTHFSESFSENDYMDLLGRIAGNEISVSNNTGSMPSVQIDIHEREIIKEPTPIIPETDGEMYEFNSEMKENGAICAAVITDYGGVNDFSYNQAAFEGVSRYANAHDMAYAYFVPAYDSDACRMGMVNLAVQNGYDVIVLPGYTFGGIIGEIQDQNPDTIFIALDVTAGDLGGASLRDNVVCTTYKEEQSGFLAGYAAVCSGYRHLGFLGGMAVPGVVRYGYGFIQGCNAAAADLEVTDQVIIEYVYGNQFYGDADITAKMDNWYQDLGVEIVFACGGGIFTSVAEAASKVQGGRVIGVDMDQAPVIDQMYGAGMTYTSATKNLGYTVLHLLSEIESDHFSSYGGQVLLLGIQSDDPDSNYVRLAPSTHFSASFSVSHYRELLSEIAAGEISVSSSINSFPAHSIILNDYGNIK